MGATGVDEAEVDDPGVETGLSGRGGDVDSTGSSTLPGVEGVSMRLVGDVGTSELSGVSLSDDSGELVGNDVGSAGGVEVTVVSNAGEEFSGDSMGVDTTGVENPGVSTGVDGLMRGVVGVSAEVGDTIEEGVSTGVVGVSREVGVSKEVGLSTGVVGVSSEVGVSDVGVSAVVSLVGVLVSRGSSGVDSAEVGVGSRLGVSRSPEEVGVSMTAGVDVGLTGDSTGTEVSVVDSGVVVGTSSSVDSGVSVGSSLGGRKVISVISEASPWSSSSSSAAPEPGRSEVGKTASVVMSPNSG
jgi:hypothetical protein